MAISNNQLSEAGFSAAQVKLLRELISEASAASEISVTTFTTAGSTEISGTLQEVLEEIADLADPV